ncbi:MAG TPA: hypothetical protein VHP99_10900, partial [Pyrinomonadaceae bacterium]|nr:hypothetical protein [Pyrinomonadaceae bacterium]
DDYDRVVGFSALDITIKGKDESEDVHSRPLNTDEYVHIKQGIWRRGGELEALFVLARKKLEAAEALAEKPMVQSAASPVDNDAGGKLQNEQAWSKALMTELQAARAEIAFLKTPRLTFEIDTQSTQVRMSGGAQVRRVEAQVKLRCLKTDVGSMAVREFHASFYKESPGGEQPIVEKVPAVRAWLLRAGVTPETNLDISDGLIIDAPISPYYWVFFHLEFPPHLDSDLSRSYFVRITMNALGQELQSIDFYVDSWNDARQSNSYITLR